MPFSKSLKAAVFISAASMAGFAAITAVPAAAHDHKKMAKEQPNIVETAQSTGVHNTLVAAVTAADLGETLSTGGPFTVFAPTDDAFAALPAGTVETLVKPENKETLTGILTYHVVGGNITAEKILEYISTGGGVARIGTLAGGVLEARLVDGNVVVTDGAGRSATVVQADVKTSNGVIHVTDGVFLPG
ncbi:fasciclin domain-containing protein [Erythrobacter sp. W53]|uniref:fasciclin domain-containing protein n=1 Tax=Erythrobacter sp. W53 TaxID=3425947 RepID=UPI003D766EBB